MPYIRMSSDNFLSRVKTNIRTSLSPMTRYCLPHQCQSIPFELVPSSQAKATALARHMIPFNLGPFMICIVVIIKYVGISIAIYLQRKVVEPEAR